MAQSLDGSLPRVPRHLGGSPGPYFSREGRLTVDDLAGAQHRAGRDICVVSSMACPLAQHPSRAHTSHRTTPPLMRTARARRDRYTRFCYHYGANGALCPWLRPTLCACRPAGRAHSPLVPGVPPPPRHARPEPRPARPDRSSWPLHTHCRSTIARGRGRSRWRVGWMCCADRSVRLSLHRLRPPRLGL